ncbi:stabilin-1 [Pyxicephalus adspersus]|uniref:stabilin-1 n=1 Tax=Pyxicephalus adspersus TaxID=30357 RepID=UPI003B5B6A06
MFCYGYGFFLLMVYVGLIASQSLQLNSKRCDIRKVLKVDTDCMSCAVAAKYVCPKGTSKVTSGTGKAGCRYTVDMGGVVLSLPGCSHTCQTVTVEPQCCSGFWGSLCTVCPGGSDPPCSGHGVCMDGLNGNGTCICDEGFTGFSCNECSDPFLYGDKCDSACQCKHGICKNGINGDGSCICEAGYMGSTCHLESLSCKALNCGADMRCVQSGGQPKCECMPGYNKQNNVCKPQNPCTPCSKFATCEVLGPRQYKCTCKPDYYGDGKTCLPFNPCSLNNGGCPQNTTRCVFRSPGKSYCSCLPGLISRGVPSQCTMPDICGSFTCGKSAHCEVVSPGKHKCVCMEGEIGDGRNCYGSLLYEIQKLNIENTDMRKKPGALRIFEEGCALTLRKFGPFTVFVPLMKASKMNETTSKFFCKTHIVAGLYMNNDLKKIGQLWTIGGDVLKFSIKGFFKSSDPKETYRITRADLPAANGIIHVINSFIPHDSTEMIESEQMTIGDMLAKQERFSRFETLLENCDLPPILNGHKSFTVFVPSNKAVDSLRDGRLIYLLTKAKHKLLELVKYHISSVASITLDRLITMPYILTTSNEIIKINVTQNGRILFGDSGIPLIHSDIIASNGVIHILDGILLPPGILPILPAKCNETEEQVIQGPCSSCDLIAPCPDGTRDMGIINQYCNFTDKGTSGTGCSRNCSRTVVVNGCCPGFFGPDCKPCAGGFSNPCYGRGSCSDGIRGSGRCACFSKYKGIACHICSDPKKHGDECEEDCRCVHGVCDNRPGSRGVCQGGRCKDGYIGEFCDQHSEPCKSVNATQFCHLNAVCVSTENTTSCQCKNGYEGDGAFCQPVDECRKPERGGCSENAICINYPTGIVCRCNPGWSGDGIECVPIDNCALEDRGGCHVNADCQFTQPGKNDCICKKGYAGDGYTCDPINRCLENNGGCHEMATCKPTSGGERTCTCPEGFAGDGLNCYGDILMELLRIPEVSIFSQWLTNSKFRIQFGQNVTALIPSDTAIMALTQEDRTFWTDSYVMPFLIRAHFLQEPYMLDQLKHHANQELATLEPRTKWEIRVIEGNLTLNDAKVITGDIPASNGFIFIIGQVLLPPLGNIPPKQPGLLKKLEQVPAWEQFKVEIQKSGLVQQIEASKHYTIFVPDNTAIKKYYNRSGSSNLDNGTIQYHVIPGEKLMPADLTNGKHISSMLGFSYWLMFFKRYNQTFVHDVPIDGSFYETNNGMLIGISEVLKILKNRCDISEKIVKKRKCNACDRGIQCPEGTELEKPIGTDICVYKKKNRNTEGCKFKCVFTKVTPQCCDGYYGHQCLHCPGGQNNSCFNNGKCQDGITGTGECICKEGFHGTACETCEAGRYGVDCKLECDCIRGKCNDGLNGDGSCQCDKGWTGSVCDIDIKNDLCNGTCSFNANCIPGPTNTTGKCFCLAGYSGNGTHCTEIDACTVNNGGCSIYANCTKAALGQARCTCIDGYSGDGIICEEIDACLENNGGCHPKAECTKTGPNKVACNCLQGYEGDGVQTCREINLCKEDNGGCSIYAMCLSTGPAKRLCLCRLGFTGDGITCTGNTAQVIRYSKETSKFNMLYRQYIEMDLHGDGPFTVFVPQLEAIENRSVIEKWTQNGLMSQFLRYHIVSCQQLLLTELKDGPSLTPMSGGSIRVSTKDDEVYLNDFAKITKSEQTSNGVIHFIDKWLIPNIPTKTSSLSLNVSQAATLHGYSTFVQLLKESNLLSVVTNKIHQPFTMLWPTDEAFNSMPAKQKKWLYHEDHKDKLAAYLKAHIIRDKKMTAAGLPGARMLRTLYGSIVSFQWSSTSIGDILLNGNSTKIIQRDLEFTEGIAHGIDQLLEPPNIGARCDDYVAKQDSNIYIGCSMCGLELSCPSGTIDRGETETCAYPRNRYSTSGLHFTPIYNWRFERRRRYERPILGCKRKCYTVVWEPQCCKNHYGGDCHACPGGLEAPCNNHGTCLDGMTGTGRCVCTEGFNGTACELCTPNRYGPDCKECTCTENGQCNDGISGDGSCFCAEGWTGQNCDIKIVLKPICSPECDGNATCRTDNECECNPYYEGDGRTCNLIDQCQNYNGGCNLQAKCSQVGIKVTCACLPGYEGDGFVCTPIDLCANGENGGCSEHATCIYTGPNTRRCECHDGYVGNGVQCLEKIIPPVDRCLENNGNCDPLAICSDLHFEEKTAGVFHLQSPKGKYQFTYEEAVNACNSEGASIATFQQLSAAQQMGYHRCTVGWLLNGTAGYPTVYPSTSCGSNHVGIVDYKRRTNLSETWDVYCYRLKDSECECPSGYVGDGSFCNGNLLEVLEAHSKTSTFYSMILDYSNSSSQGAEFLDLLVNRSSYRTLFVPEDGSFNDNVTITWRDLEHHITKLDILVPYSNLTNGTMLLSNTGYNLSIADFLSNCSHPPVSRRRLRLTTV